MLWQLTFFLLLQQWFSTILLKRAKSRPRVSRLAFFRPNFRNLALFEAGWPKKFYLAFFWPQLKLVGLKKFVWPFCFFWHFYAEKISYEGKYYHSILIGNTFAK